MVRGGDDHDVSRQGIYLQQERANHTLDLSGFVQIPPFLPDHIELVEEQHAPTCAGVVEQPSNTDRGFPKV